MAHLKDLIVNGSARIIGKLYSSEFIGKLVGNADTASKWATARNINGMSVQGDANRVNYGTCSTAAATAAKTVACTGFALVTGAEIVVKFTVTNTAANPTLNVNSTGAKAIYYRGSAISAGYLAANRTYSFRYNGTQWELVGDINTDSNTTYSQATSSALGLVKIGYTESGKNYPVELNSNGQMFVNVPWTDNNTTYSNFVKSGSGAKAGLVPAPSTTAGTTKYLREDGTWQVPPDNNTTYSPQSLGNGYGTCSTAAATAAKVVTLSGYNLTTNGFVAVKFTYNVPANATMNINSKGAKAIYYDGKAITANIIRAGDLATFVYNGSQYHLICIANRSPYVSGNKLIM